MITAIVWTAIGLPDQAVVRTITVLVIACPHALGLAIPLVVAIATERAARGGVLIKDRLALESMRTVDTVLFDKTGTLTKGQPTVTAIHTAGDYTEDEILALAASAETDSEHPLARAIVAAAEHRSLQLQPATDFTSSPAVGVTATVDGRPGAGRRTEPAARERGSRTGGRRRVARRRGDHPARPRRRPGGRRPEAGRRDPARVPRSGRPRCTPATCRW